jgi:hypothetical protein
MMAGQTTHHLQLLHLFGFCFGLRHRICCLLLRLGCHSIAHLLHMPRAATTHPQPNAPDARTTFIIPHG